MGLPFLSGFYSKDILLNWAFANFDFFSQYVYWLLVFAAFFTSFYSTKLIYLTFFSKSPRFPRTVLQNVHESDFRFKLPLFLLTLFSIFSGFVFFDFFIGYGNDMLNLPVSLTKNYYFDMEFLTQFRKYVPFFFVIFGSLTYLISHSLFFHSYNFFVKYRWWFKFFIRWKNFFSKKWFFDFFYYHLVVLTLNFGYNVLFKNIDKGILEDIFVKKPIFYFTKFSNFQSSFQTSKINQYLIFTLILFFFLFFIISIFFEFFFTYFAFVSFFIFFKFYSKWKKL